jgi:hypothetical protein
MQFIYKKDCNISLIPHHVKNKSLFYPDIKIQAHNWRWWYLERTADRLFYTFRMGSEMCCDVIWVTTPFCHIWWTYYEYLESTVNSIPTGSYLDNWLKLTLIFMIYSCICSPLVPAYFASPRTSHLVDYYLRQFVLVHNWFLNLSMMRANIHIW